jgi:hypothetical protein
MSRALVLSALLAAFAPALFAVSPGAASGSMTLNTVKITLTSAAARLQPQSYDATQTEIELVMSDRPLSSDDLEDDTIPASRGYLTVRFVKGAPFNYVLHFGMSETGAGDGLKFEGTVTDKAITGRVFTSGVISIFDGKDKLQFDVQVNAPVYSMIQKPLTPADKAAVMKSEQLKLYKAYLAADSAELLRPTLSKSLAARLDEMSGMVSMVKSDIEPDKVTPLRLTVSGDTAVMMVETTEKKGNVRFVRENGVWKVNRETVKYK